MVFQTYLEAWADAVNAPLRNIVCNDLRGQLDRLATGLSGAVGIVPGGGYLNPMLAPLLVPTGCTPVPPVDFPPRGGQCSGVLYKVDMARYRPDGTIDNVSFRNVVGPIASTGGEWTPDFFGNLQFTVTCVAPNDTEPPTPGIRKFGPSSYTDNDKLSRGVLVQITREDGLPDTCGNGGFTPDPPDPQYGPFTMNSWTVNIAGNDVTFNGTAVFAPITFIPSVGVRIPVRISVSPNLYFPVSVDVPVYLKLPDLSIDTDISFVQNSVTLNVDSDTAQPSTLAYTKRIVGVNITSTVASITRVSTIAGSGSASDLQVPWLAIVRFVPPAGYSASEGTDILVKTESQYVPCPWWYGASGYTILENAGVSCSAVSKEAYIADLVKPA